MPTVDGNERPSPLKAARTILTASIQVKIRPQPVSYLISLDLFRRCRRPCGPGIAVQQYCHTDQSGSHLGDRSGCPE